MAENPTIVLNAEESYRLGRLLGALALQEVKDLRPEEKEVKLKVYDHVADALCLN